jgi:hypothetical protein
MAPHLIHNAAVPYISVPSHVVLSGPYAAAQLINPAFAGLSRFPWPAPQGSVVLKGKICSILAPSPKSMILCLQRVRLARSLSFCLAPASSAGGFSWFGIHNYLSICCTLRVWAPPKTLLFCVNIPTSPSFARRARQSANSPKSAASGRQPNLDVVCPRRFPALHHCSAPAAILRFQYQSRNVGFYRCRMRLQKLHSRYGALLRNEERS